MSDTAVRRALVQQRRLKVPRALHDVVSVAVTLAHQPRNHASSRGDLPLLLRCRRGAQIFDVAEDLKGMRRGVLTCSFFRVDIRLHREGGGWVWKKQSCSDCFTLLICANVQHQNNN